MVEAVQVYIWNEQNFTIEQNSIQQAWNFKKLLILKSIGKRENEMFFIAAKFWNTKNSDQVDIHVDTYKNDKLEYLLNNPF